MKELTLKNKINRDALTPQIKAAMAELMEMAEKSQQADAEAAAAYEASYDADIKNGFRLISEAQADVDAINSEIARAEANLTNSLINRDVEAQRAAEEEIRQLKIDKSEKEKRLQLLSEYKPTGDADLFAEYEKAHEKAYAAAEEISAAWNKLRGTVGEIADDLRYMYNHFGAAPITYGVDAGRAADLSKARRGENTLGAAVDMQEEKAAAYQKWVKDRAVTLYNIGVVGSHKDMIEKEKNKDVLAELEKMKRGK